MELLKLPVDSSRPFIIPGQDEQRVDARAHEQDMEHQSVTSDVKESHDQEDGDNGQHNEMRVLSAEDFETYLEAVRRQLEGKPSLMNFAEDLMEQGRSLCRLFQQTGIVGYINNAIYIQSRATSLASDAYRYKPSMLSTLGFTHRTRSEHLNNLEDVEKAIEYTTQAVTLAPEGYQGNPDHAQILVNLSVCYFQRFQLLGKPVDLDAAIIQQNRAVSLTSDSHASRVGILSNLGIFNLTRYERFGELADVSKAIDCLHQALELVLNDQEAKLPLLGNLASSYRQRFERQEEIEDLDQAVHFQGQIVSIIPEAHPLKRDTLKDLGNLYQNRFLLLGRFADAGEAINCWNKAIAITPDDHADRPGLLNKLGFSYRSRFQQFGEPSDADKAVSYITQAVSLVQDDQIEKRIMLNDLGIAHQNRFESLGDLADIDKAIDYTSQALTLCPEDHALMPAALNTLGISYQSRFERLHELADLNQAISFKNQALILTPTGHKHRPMMLLNLGISYHDLFEHSHKLTDINKAINYMNEANLLIQDGDIHKPRALLCLIDSYRSRFMSGGTQQDIDQSIACGIRAATLLPDNRADKLRVLSKLGASYNCRYERLGEPTDLGKAIDSMNQAIGLAPSAHVEKAGILNRLGWSHFYRFKHLNKHEDVVLAVDYFQRSAQSATGPPSVKFMASQHWAKLSFETKLSSPLLAYQHAMGLVPQLIWMGTTIDQRYKFITELGSFITEAAFCAISHEAYDQALEWLEEGRSIVWNQILQLRTPFEDLFAINAPLASRLKELSRELEHAGSQSSKSYKPLSTTDTKPDLHLDAQQHHRLATEWDQLIQQVREIPGFYDFMRPRRASELVHAALDGPVVVVNVHPIRCDALVVRPNSERVVHLPLQNLSFDKALSARIELMSLVGHRGDRAGGFRRIKPVPEPDEVFRGVLVTLWSNVVKPILDFLGYTQKFPAAELPHITWCTTGPLSFLPLHAAGLYNGSDLNVFELAVSSYTPTLSALLTSRSRKASQNKGILSVGQEHTEGLGSLPNTVPELAAIREHAEANRYLQLDGSSATVEAVLSAMGEYDWVHLACHASQMISDPSQSAFHLSDGSLALATITKQSFGNKGLAFLSACQTATGDEKLPDEAVHLAAGMLMAGYPSVIATMWSIHDEDAPVITRHVYADLLKDGRMDHTQAARALHHAVAALREKVGEQSYRRWVPFIHIGL